MLIFLSSFLSHVSFSFGRWWYKGRECLAQNNGEGCLSFSFLFLPYNQYRSSPHHPYKSEGHLTQCLPMPATCSLSGGDWEVNITTRSPPYTDGRTFLPFPSSIILSFPKLSNESFLHTTYTLFGWIESLGKVSVSSPFHHQSLPHHHWEEPQR